MSKKYKQDEVAQVLTKSIISNVKKALAGKTPVEDVIDPNFKPEADPSKIPAPKESVMNKSKGSKLKGFLDKKMLKKKKC
jgi:hypothetical protein